MIISNFHYCPNKSNLSFKAMHVPYAYDLKDIYFLPGYNGRYPDEFVLNLIPPDSKVLDIGAGDGRNTIPIAQKGCKVTALELSSDARNMIKKIAKNNNLNSVVNVKEQSIIADLDSRSREKYNYAVMCNVSMHFTIEEMNKVFQNANKILDEDGTFIFNALVYKDKNMESDNSYYKQSSGKIVFNENQLKELAKKNNFDVEIHDYAEEKYKRPNYMSEWLAFGDTNIKWFVLRKKEDNPDAPKIIYP